MAKIRLAFVQEFHDRHGTVRRYFRRPGCKRVPLPGLLGSEEFMAAYQAAVANEPAPLAIGRVKAGTLAAAVGELYAESAKFLRLKPVTQAGYRSIFEGLRDKYGDKRIALLDRGHVERLLAEKATVPSSARRLLYALRMLLDFAAKRGMRRDNPALDVEVPKLPKTGGFHAWSEEEIAQFEAAHPTGTQARLAMALMPFTAQRGRSDVTRLGRQHVHRGMIGLTQEKTGTSLMIPVHPDLAAIIAATPSGHLSFLTTAKGQPFTPAAFGNWFRERCRDAGLPKQCSAHGLRKAQCRRLAEAGASANVIAAISGHKTLREVERYTRDADQARMARAGMELTVAAFPTLRTKSAG